MVSSGVLSIVIPYVASILYLACIKRTIINNEMGEERESENEWMNEWERERESLNLACKFEIAAEKNKNNGGERRCRERGR